MNDVLGIDKWADLPAEKVHQYLQAYVDRYDLGTRLRLNTRVVSVEKDGANGWVVEVKKGNLEDESQVPKDLLRCEKLIIATGTSSSPSLPQTIDWTSFRGPVMHSKDVGAKHHLLTADQTKRVTVVGGNKSAVDVVNLCALAGKKWTG